MSYNYYEAPEGKMYKDKRSGRLTKKLALQKDLVLEDNYELVSYDKEKNS